MSHTTKTIPVPKEWAKFVQENAIKRGHPGGPWMSVSEIAKLTGRNESAVRRQVRGMKSCAAIFDGKQRNFYRP